MEEYIQLMADKAHKRGQMFDFETATYGKIYDDIDIFKDFKADFLAIVYNDALTYDPEVSSEPTVSPLDDNEIDFKIYDEDYTVIYDKNSFSYKIISVNDLKLNSKNNDNKVNISSDDVVVEQSDSGIDANVDTQYDRIQSFTHEKCPQRLVRGKIPTISPRVSHDVDI
ncbi:hypothetical protein Tco_0566264 [Tanacetum coccineum]